MQASAELKGTLFHLVLRGELAEVKRALAESSTPVQSLVNKQSQNLLFYAVQRKRWALEVCKLLSDMYGVQMDHVDNNGQTALYWVAKTENISCAKLLVEGGCEINHRDGLLDQTPVFYAAHSGSLGMIRQLVALNADLYAQDRWRFMPMFWAGSTENCKELACYSALASRGPESKPVLKKAVQWHRDHDRPAVASFLAACAEAWTMPKAAAWSVRWSEGIAALPSASSPSSSSSSLPVSSYATCLAQRKHVDRLCSLEDEFIEDHKTLLQRNLTHEQVCEQVGLNPEASRRRTTIITIAQEQHKRQTGSDTRHYTLACHHFGITPSAAPSKSSKLPEVVGYLYFKVVNGARADDGEPENADVSETSVHMKGESGLANVCHLVVSHIKVDRRCQKAGVATLLLASMLQHVVADHATRPCRSLHLCVAAVNSAAIGLYSKLGFVTSRRKAEHKGWVSMHRPITERSLEIVYQQWLQLAWQSSPSSICPQLRVDEAIADERPTRRQKRKLSPTHSLVSELSTSAGSTVISSIVAHSSSADELESLISIPPPASKRRVA